MESEGSSNEIAPLQNVRKARSDFFKTALNIFRGRSLSVGASTGLRRSNDVLDPAVLNYQEIHNRVDLLQTSVTYCLQLKNCIDIIHSNLTCSEFSYLDDSETKREIILTVQQVQEFTRCILRLHQTRDIPRYLSEKSNYGGVAKLQYQQHLEAIKNQPRQIEAANPDMTRRLTKATDLVEKINVMRAITPILIACLAASSKQFPELQRLRTAHRRNFRVEDFVDTWEC